MTDDIERDLQEKVCESVSLHKEGVDRFRVVSPFVLDDGDHLSIVLRRENSSWVLSDEGTTYMHLSYSIPESAFQKGTRQKIISNTLSSFQVLDREGELLMPIRNEKYGHALYSFIQAMLKINDVTFLTKERVRSTFMEDFRAFMTEQSPKNDVRSIGIIQSTILAASTPSIARQWHATPAACVRSVE